MSRDTSRDTLSDVVVVGASLAGLRSCESLRARGYEGRLTLIGAESHQPYDRPPLSKEILTGKWELERTALRRTPIEDLDLDLRLGVAAESVDLSASRVGLAGGDSVPFGALVIATGARVRTLPIFDGYDNVHVLRTLDDALGLRQAFAGGARVAVVGAGFIGAEVASSARACGLDVTLVDVADRPMARVLEPRLAEIVSALHRDHGVDLRLGVGVERVLGEASIEALCLSDGGRIDVDAVVVAVGVTPNTEWLRDSAIDLDDGVLCDACCRVTVSSVANPGVVAAGDVARWLHEGYGETVRMEHWTNAAQQADAAVATLLAGGDAKPYVPLPYFWSDQHGVKMQLAGRMEPEDALHFVHGSVDEGRFVALAERAGKLAGVFAWKRPRRLIEYSELIERGATIDEALTQANA